MMLVFVDISDNICTSIQVRGDRRRKHHHQRRQGGGWALMRVVPTVSMAAVADGVPPDFALDLQL